MSHEFIYTSVPQGLRPGTRGFCTVAITNGIPAGLVERLESISGYRHLFEPQTAQAHLNPVNWSYLRITAANARYQVLSRVADAGLDYSQRTNKLAHHLACSAPECPAAGPAAALRQPGLMLSGWNEKPHVLPTGRVPRNADRSAQPCQEWQRTMGDAGWAGLLAETVANKTDAYLIYQPGLEVLDLFVEAIALLPADQRWEATFQTYYTRLPPGIDCRWRGVIAGSEEEVHARRSANALIIDTTRKAKVPKETPAVLAARSGQPLPVKVAATLSPPGFPGVKAVPAPPTIRSAPPELVPDLPAAESELDPMQAVLPPPTLPAWDPSKAKKIKRGKTRIYALNAAAVLLVVGGVIGGMYVMGAFDTPEVIANPDSENKPEPKQPVVVPPKVNPDATKGETPEQLMAKWEVGVKKSLEEVIEKNNQLDAAKNKLQEKIDKAQKNAASIDAALIARLEDSRAAFEKQIIDFEKTWANFKKTNESDLKKDRFPKSSLHQDFATYENKPTELRKIIDAMKKDIAALENSRKEAVQQASHDKRRSAIEEAIKKINVKPYLDLGAPNKKDGVPINDVSVINFEVPNVNEIQLELLNLPKTYTLNNKLTLIKNTDTPGGDNMELGQFSLNNQGLQFQPKRAINDSLKDLASGVLRIVFDPNNKNDSAHLSFVRPVIKADGLDKFDNRIRIPISQLKEKRKIEWSYPASLKEELADRQETLHLEAKVVPLKSAKQEAWQSETQRAFAPLVDGADPTTDKAESTTDNAQQRLQFSWGFKRDGTGDKIPSVLEFEPLLIHFENQQYPPLADALLDKWLEDTIHEYRAYEMREEKRKKMAMNDMAVNQRRSDRILIDQRWPIAWVEKCVDNKIKKGQRVEFMQEKYAPLINKYQLEIRAYRRILSADGKETIDIELPYHN